MTEKTKAILGKVIKYSIDILKVILLWIGASN